MRTSLRRVFLDGGMETNITARIVVFNGALDSDRYYRYSSAIREIRFATAAESVKESSIDCTIFFSVRWIRLGF